MVWLLLHLIGYNLAKMLLEDPNNYVTIIDNFITGQHKHIQELANCKYCKRFEYYTCDITNYEKLKLFFYNINVDEIYHLASIASPPKYLKYPLETMDVNVIGTKNILELIKETNIKFLLASTSEI
jgi:nucleoside-diphosphate-sugar epimerase